MALAQTAWVQKQLRNQFPDIEISVKVITTSADKDISKSIRGGSSIGVFVKEIEDALLSKEIDLAVHSMKDVPTRVPSTLRIAAIPEREDARDALITKGPPVKLTELPKGSLVGTGSIRRQAQILAHRPDLIVRDIRGNIETRLQKLKNGDYDAIILACAGLNRLGLQDQIATPLDLGEMLPAPGQGALALEIRMNDLRVETFAVALNHQTTANAVLAERSFLRRMGGGCNVPVAVHARLKEGLMEIEGLVASVDGAKIIRDSVRQHPNTANDAADFLADKMLARGGRNILEELP